MYDRYIYKNLQFDSLVWGLLMVTLIKYQTTFMSGFFIILGFSRNVQVQGTSNPLPGAADHLCLLVTSQVTFPCVRKLPLRILEECVLL